MGAWQAAESRAEGLPPPRSDLSAHSHPAQTRAPRLTTQAFVLSGLPRQLPVSCLRAPAPLWGDTPAGWAPHGSRQAVHSSPRLQQGPCARILPNDPCFLTEGTEASPTQPPSREDL